MEPIAATVAGPDPETAAKNIHNTIVTVASPPVNLPKNTLHTFNRRLDTPPAPISSPARINNGIAISGKESALVTNCCTIYKELIRPSAKIAQREDTPIAIPTGIFKTKVTTNAINKTAATTIFHPRFFPAVFLPNTRLPESA